MRVVSDSARACHVLVFSTCERVAGPFRHPRGVSHRTPLHTTSTCERSPCWSQQARTLTSGAACVLLRRPSLTLSCLSSPPGDHHMSDDHLFNLLEDDCSLLGSLLDECLSGEVGLATAKPRAGAKSKPLTPLHRLRSPPLPRLARR